MILQDLVTLSAGGSMVFAISSCVPDNDSLISNPQIRSHFGSTKMNLDKIDILCDQFEQLLKKKILLTPQEFCEQQKLPENERLMVELNRVNAEYGQARDGPESTAAIPASTKHGQVIGPYKLLQQIGEGGMGTVYMAEQETPVQRRVALKVIKLGMGSKEVIARFESERQALAMMDHENIAKMFDAGTTDDGRPYFVMELVRGVPLTRFCDDNKLSIKERLEIFVTVCQAVQHAHQKGIIHRDIKPSNVLVSNYDGRPVPKVIDFGVAKAMRQKLTDKTLFTELGRVIGTLQYMSPEQAGLSQLDIDTRSDIYSLGVLLYELLTGSTPINRKRIREVGWERIMQVIREEEPPKPSTKLSESGDAIITISDKRRTSPQSLSSFVRVDLDWIVMKALEKDRTRRYETANGLARDIERHLADEVVEARPPSFYYRAGRFLRKNKGAAVAGSLVFLAVLTAIVGTSWGLVTANSQKVRAENNEKTALREKRVAESVLDLLLTKLLSQADTQSQANTLLSHGDFVEKTNRNVTVRELLDRAAVELAPETIEKNFPDQPLVQAEMLHTVGKTYVAVAEPGKAVPLLQRAVSIRELHLEPENEQTWFTKSELAAAYYRAGQFQESLRIFEQLGKAFTGRYGPTHRDTLTMHGNLGLAKFSAGRRSEAIGVFEQVLQSASDLPLDDELFLITRNNLATAYVRDERPEDAIRQLEQVRAVFEKKLSSSHPLILTTLTNLGASYCVTGRRSDGIDLLEQIREIVIEKYGPTHQTTLSLLHNLGVSYTEIGRSEKAVQLLEQVRDCRLEKLGFDHPKTQATLLYLARSYTDLKRFDEAIKPLEQIREYRIDKLGVDDPQTQEVLNNVAVVYFYAGKSEKTIEILELITDLDSQTDLAMLHNLAHAYRLQERYSDAIRLLERVRRGAEDKYGLDHLNTLKAINGLALTLQQSGDLPEAIPLFELARERAIASQKGLANFAIRAIFTNLAMAYDADAQFAEAIKMYEQVHEYLEHVQGADSPEANLVKMKLAESCSQAKQFDKSIKLLKELVAYFETTVGRDDIETIHTIANLGEVYKTVGNLPEAISLLEEAYSSVKKNPKFDWVGLQLLDGFVKSKNRERVSALVKELLDEKRSRLPEGSPELATQLARLGSALLNVDFLSEAEPLLRECLDIRKKAIANSWLTSNTQSMLGGALLGQQKYGQAEPLLLSGYEGMIERKEMVPEQARVRLTEALERLTNLYENWHEIEADQGYDAKAAEWQQKLDKYNAKQAAEATTKQLDGETNDPSVVAPTKEKSASQTDDENNDK